MSESGKMEWGGSIRSFSFVENGTQTNVGSSRSFARKSHIQHCVQFTANFTSAFTMNGHISQMHIKIQNKTIYIHLFYL